MIAKDSQFNHFSDGSEIKSIHHEEFLDTISEYYLDNFVHLSTIIGYHDNDHIILLYPISTPNQRHPDCLFVKTELPVERPIIASVSSFYPGAYVYERELKELLGIEFHNQAYKPLLLPDDFSEGIYPLRKSYTTEELQNMLDEKEVGFNRSTPLPDPKSLTMSIGPQHPTHKEPIRFQFYITGESIDDVDLRLGFNHRGIEKALEAGTWQQNLYLIERICGICSAAHQLAYTTTAEKIADIVHDVPERAQWIRVLVAELERIHSHILWYGVLAHDAGYDMLFHVTWRDREIVMDILELITGNRVNYSMMTLGGVRRDIIADHIPKLQAQLHQLKDAVINHEEILNNERSFIQRMQGIGTLSKSEAIRYNTVGPTARASGISFDIRKDVPYSAYGSIPFEIPVEQTGDIFASLQVRLKETLESIDICQYVLNNLPSGQISMRVGSKLPEGEAHTRIEAPRGEDIHFIRSTGGQKPDRHKVRAPTLANVTSLMERFKQMQVADIPMIIRLIDPCIGCMERVSFVDTSTGRYKELEGNDLLNKSKRSHLKGKEIRIFR